MTARVVVTGSAIVTNDCGHCARPLMFLVAGGAGTIRDHVRLVKGVLLMTFLAGAIDALERRRAFGDAIVQAPEKPVAVRPNYSLGVPARDRKRSHLADVLCASRKRTGVEKFRRLFFLDKNKWRRIRRAEEAD